MSAGHTFNGIRWGWFIKYWQDAYTIHGERHNARGVASLFGNKFEHIILHIDRDKEGQLIVIDLELGEHKLD